MNALLDRTLDTIPEGKEPGRGFKVDMTINVPTLITGLGLVISLTTGLVNANNKIDQNSLISQQLTANISQLTANVNQLTTNTAVLSDHMRETDDRLDRLENRTAK